MIASAIGLASRNFIEQRGILSKCDLPFADFFKKNFNEKIVFKESLKQPSAHPSPGLGCFSPGLASGSPTRLFRPPPGPLSLPLVAASFSHLVPSVNHVCLLVNTCRRLTSRKGGQAPQCWSKAHHKVALMASSATPTLLRHKTPICPPDMHRVPTSPQPHHPAWRAPGPSSSQNPAHCSKTKVPPSS